MENQSLIKQKEEVQQQKDNIQEKMEESDSESSTKEVAEKGVGSDESSNLLAEDNAMDGIDAVNQEVTKKVKE